MSEAEPPEQEKKCAYKNPLLLPITWEETACPETAWPESKEGYCLYHWPENGKSEELAKKVWDRAREKVEKNETQPNELEEQYMDFRGWHFPSHPSGGSFVGTAFESSVSYYGAAVKFCHGVPKTTLQKGRIGAFVRAFLETRNRIFLPEIDAAIRKLDGEG